MIFSLATSSYFRFIIRQKFDPKNVVISLATINIISCGYPGSKEKCSFLKYFLPHCQREKKDFPGNKYFISLLLRLGAFLGMIWRWRIVQNRATGFPGKGKQHRFVVCSKPESRPTTSPPFNTAFLYFHHHHSHPECFIA